MNSRFLINSTLLVALLTGTAAQAQTRVPPRRPGSVAPKPRVTANAGVGLKDGLTMQKGRVVLTELGITNPLTADKKLINGTIITPAGLVTATDGTTTQMNEGDMVSLTGRVTTRASIVEADSLLKIKTFDLRYPGKRKKMEEEKERKDKAKAKLAEEKAKAAEKRAKAKAKR
ncbi:hypothetical protein AUC43_03495 [Hymenobacter sedentarius]|uniref:DUF6799 domain-containing protein n=1 Tax=Hymenobacter sedentarius TaxID=1411621 RepID=A0A0U4BVE8_9BACT|nr:DUF6799 domain-containing protein [Hymenobacter sedentarius]ALW84241.1 hypothetical protein AUC43_03495 [Hymenobacter sedentarius]